MRDPTYMEVLEFIALDQTDRNHYRKNAYTCYNFAQDLKTNAFRAGYRCGIVIIEFTDGGHAIVCFNSTDKGMIFVEPQTDEIVKVVPGELYQSKSFTGGTVKKYTIIW